MCHIKHLSIEGIRYEKQQIQSHLEQVIAEDVNQFARRTGLAVAGVSVQLVGRQPGEADRDLGALAIVDVQVDL